MPHPGENPDPVFLVHLSVFKPKPYFIDQGLKSMGIRVLRHHPNKANTNSNKIAPLILKFPI